MKIAQLIGSLLSPLGGAEQYCVELSRAQSAAGHTVTIVTGWASPEVVAELASDGIEVRVIPVWRPYPPDRKGSRPAAVLFHALDLVQSRVTPRGLRRAIVEGGWDVVHAHRVAGLGAHVLRTAAVAGARVVMTIHDYSLVDTSTTLLRDGVEAAHAPRIQQMRTRLLRRSLRGAQFVFPTTRLREKHAAWGMRVPADSVVIPHGWRVTRSDKRLAPTPSDGCPVIFLFLGKLLTTKGLDLLLDAWGSGLPDAELWIAGSGPMQPQVAEAAALGRVRELGWLDATARGTALAAASVVVAPSVWPEIFLLSAAEGVIAGVPVLSTTIAAPPAVVNELSGLLVGADAAAIRAGMVRLLNPELRTRLAVGTRQVARELDFDRHAARIESLYGQQISTSSITTSAQTGALS